MATHWKVNSPDFAFDDCYGNFSVRCKQNLYGRDCSDKIGKAVGPMSNEKPKDWTSPNAVLVKPRSHRTKVN